MRVKHKGVVTMIDKMRSVPKSVKVKLEKLEIRRMCYGRQTKGLLEEMRTL